MAAYQTAFFNGISFSISAETIATLPLVVSFVALSTSNYVVRVGGASRLSVATRSAQVTLACAIGMVVGGIASEILHQSFDVASWIRENRGQAILSFGLYFLVLRKLIFVPLGRFVRDGIGPGMLQSLAVRSYEALVHGPYWNALRLSFAVLVGASIPMFQMPWMGAVHAAIADCARNDETRLVGLQLLSLECIGAALPVSAAAFVIALLLPFRSRPRPVIAAAAGVITMTGLVAVTFGLANIKFFFPPVYFGPENTCRWLMAGMQD